VVPVYSPSWAPDGLRLVGSREGSSISVFDLRTRTERQIYVDEGAGDPGLSSPDWSPNGKQIAMTYEFGGNYGIAFYDVARRRLVRHAIDGGQDPSWSPDGRRIAFDTYTGERKVDQSSIYVARAEGTPQRRLVVRNGHSPAWSPDGKLIAFARMVTPTNSEIFVVNANGTGLRRLTKYVGADEAPTWQPLPGR
jgi:Tol biopolymer transport system component